MSAPIAVAARVDSAGTVTRLGVKPAPDEGVTEKDVQEPAKLARILAKLLGDVAALRRRWAPRHVTFDDILLGTSGALVTLQHNFGGRVRWWVVDNQISGATSYLLQRDITNTTADTLVLNSYTVAIVSIRVEEAG